MKKSNLNKDIATGIKRLLDADEMLADDTGAWHVLVGKSFASSITYQTKFVMFFDLLEYHKTFLIFKTNV
jgi:hypothetical protein